MEKVETFHNNDAGKTHAEIDGGQRRAPWGSECFGRVYPGMGAACEKKAMRRWGCAASRIGRNDKMTKEVFTP